MYPILRTNSSGPIDKDPFPSVLIDGNTETSRVLACPYPIKGQFVIIFECDVLFVILN